ncbi:FMN-dependent dehydrogenase-domain-containing protein [Radiomyces spectabilis]|uniref:FMN-dependent dehydrogenase-domain-containing protein n=1 Tax=Radiomyces spectabilis TaxID=64574 RepID=UPI0022205102|nr:FMN-dependent dehydrogenase-domain-containing protein [Radiomyces spectabilis]KAI8393625.1 FMN-dependent dehydrogenase-domain-containing protein [Radiomyces spectabilis]
MAEAKMKMLSQKEVSQHNTKEDLWVIIHDKVYDLTQFLPDHPGGQSIILKYAGRDATNAFDPVHPPDIISRYLTADVCMGEIDVSTLENEQREETEEEKRIKLARENMPKIEEMYNSFDFESIAKTILKAEAWAYYSSGADDEISMRENHNAFHRIWLRPRVMVNVKNIDTTAPMLRTTCSMPLYITGTALGKLGHPEGEVVLTRAAADANIIQMIPTLASCSFDQIVDAATPEQTQWLQLYVNSDREVTKKFIQHAEKRGVKGLFVTVDAPQLGRREKDMRSKYSDEAPGEMENKDQDVNRGEGAARYISTFIDPSLNWEDLKWLKSITKMPIMLKGIQTAEDAVLAAQHGCQGIVISNHGGRQLDFAPSAIEILPEVMDALQKEGLDKDFEVYIDGGIRRGSDIFKAIALGAKGVGIGRPALYAMATYGDAGVKRLIQLLKDELVMCMRLMGAPTLGHITRDMVDIRNLKDHFVQSPTDNLSGSSYEKMIPRGLLSKL